MLDPVQSVAQHTIAKAELEAYATDVFTRLAKEDGPTSTLNVFCRVDIGYWQRTDGQLCFFVNEVERGHTLSFWSATGPHMAGMAGAGISECLRCWFEREMSRISSLQVRTRAQV